MLADIPDAITCIHVSSNCKGDCCSGLYKMPRGRQEKQTVRFKVSKTFQLLGHYYLVHLKLLRVAHIL